MLADTIPLVIIGISLLIILIIAIRKFPNISNIDVSTIPEEKEAAIKNRIMSERLARKTISQVNGMVKFVLPAWGFMQKNFRKMYQRASDMDKKYRKYISFSYHL